MKKDIWIMQVEITRNENVYEDVVSVRCDENAISTVEGAFEMWLEEYNAHGKPASAKLIKRLAVATIRVGSIRFSVE